MVKSILYIEGIITFFEMVGESRRFEVAHGQCQIYTLEEICFPGPRILHCLDLSIGHILPASNVLERDSRASKNK
jgi:hypothetical protein